MLAHIMGLDNASGAWYLFWSGFCGDLGLFAGVFAFLHHKNCHTKGCWRLSRHPHTTCRKHAD